MQFYFITYKTRRKMNVRLSAIDRLNRTSLK